LAAGVLAGGWLVAGVAAAPAAHAAGCTTSNGVTVVVDFGSLGGGIQVGCASGGQSSGLGALSAAGFPYTFVPRQPGLVCQIASLPSPCNGAPTNAYWAYWHAQPGGTWSYSTLGAGSYTPPAGSVEGWAFGAGAQPGIAPPRLPATPRPPPRSSTHPPAPPPAPSGGGAGGGPAGSGGTGGTGGTGAHPAGTGAHDTAAAKTGTRSAGSPPPATTPPATSPGAIGPAAGGPAAGGPATTGPPTGAPQPAADQRSAGGVGLGVIVTLLLVLALAGLAGFAQYRRRAAR
jgi:hypothetical protein